MRVKKKDLPKLLQKELDRLDSEKMNAYKSLDNFNIALEIFNEYNPQMPTFGQIEIITWSSHCTFRIVFWTANYKDIIPAVRKLRKITGLILTHYHYPQYNYRDFTFGSISIKAYLWHTEGSTCAYIEDGFEKVPKRKMLCGKKLEAWKKEHNK